MQRKVRTVDQTIALMAGRAQGVVARDELLPAGISDGEITTRLNRGSLIRVHRGVYRVGHAAPTTEATYTAAVKACGKGAVISGRAAAHLHGLIRSRQAPPPEVTAPKGHRLSGVVVHRTTRTPQGTRVKGIPTTTVPRTLVDLAAVLPEDELARAVHEAQVKYRTKPDQIEAILPPKAKGAGTLRRILRGDTHLVLSKLEKAFLELLTKHHLPLPETNKQSGSFFVDCRWPKKMLTIELDGYRYHASRHAWQQDRKREREARARGDRFRRYSWDDVTKHPATTAAELQELLA